MSPFIRIIILFLILSSFLFSNINAGKKCYGKDETDPTVCSGRGSCIVGNTCQCLENYFGNECEINICFGFLSNITTQVCSGRGICNDTNSCICNSGWNGNNDCSTPSCELVNGCSSHGVCSSPNTCECDSGWKGNAYCSAPSCESVPGGNCASGFSCIGPNTCGCKPGWKPESNCLAYNCTNACENGLSCVGPNLCGNETIVDNDLLKSGFLSFPNDGTIDIIDSNATVSMSGRGGFYSCYNSGASLFVKDISSFNLQYSLEVQYSFELDGETPGSGIALLSDARVSPGLMEYFIFGPSYYGMSPVTVSVSGAIKTGTGGCDDSSLTGKPGNTGPFEITTEDNQGYLKVLKQDLYYFFWKRNQTNDWTLIGSLTTKSKINYIGVFASSFSTPFKVNYTDINFQVPVCGGKLATDKNVCPYQNQICSFKGVCECLNGWTGENCSVPICTNPCKHGACIAPDTCNCTYGHSGQTCEKHNCFGVPYDGEACNNRGTCLGVDMCDCIDGYKGKNCEIYTCFGITSNDSRVCSGKGTCIDNDICSCNDGWKSTTDCSLFSCEKQNNCGSKGVCVGPNQCSCPNGWKGPECTYSCDNGCNNGNTCVGSNYCSSPYSSGISNFTILSTSPAGSIILQESTQTIDLSISSIGQERLLWNCQNLGQANLILKDVEYPNFSFESSYSLTHMYVGYGFHSGIILYYEENGKSYFVMFGPSILSGLSYDGSISLQASLDIDCQLTAQKFSKLNGNYGPFEITYQEHNTGNIKVVRSSQEGYSFYAKGSGAPWTLVGFVKTNIVFPKIGFFLRTFPGGGWTDISFANIVGTTTQCTNCSQENMECSINNECVCKAGWKGSLSNCSIPSCEFVNNCSNNGTCVGPNQCECKPNYFGKSCQYTTCDGILSNTTSVCNGRGTCVALDTCVCNNGFKGFNCSEFMCTSCNNRGSCIGPNQCLCNNGWKGSSDCKAASCESTNPNTQYCGKSLDYDEPLPNYKQDWTWYNPSVTGYPRLQLTINETEIKIKSTIDWYWEDCQNLGGVFYREIPYAIGWSAEARMTNVVFDAYYSSGLILYIPNPKRYYLKVGFHTNSISLSGDLGNGCFENKVQPIDIFEPPLNYYFKISRTLSNAYQFYFRSNTTSTWNIIGTIDSAINFNRLGYFTMGYTTYSSATFTDFKLNLPTCDGKNHTDTTICSGKGKCVGYNSCTCNAGSYGQFCHLNRCFGIYSNQPNVCSGNGVCESNDKCKCNNGFYGDKCEKSVCWSSMVASDGRIVKTVASGLCDRINTVLLGR